MNLIIRSLFSFSVLIVVACSDEMAPVKEPITAPDQKEYVDVAYATTSEKQKLDIYLPQTGNGPFPVLIWVHGGGWKGGDKAEFKNTNRLTELRNRDYAIVVINYRLSGEAKFPAQIFDVKAAIRWVKANASQYAFNKDKIGVWGSSAGGHLVALAGTSGGVTELEDLSLGNSSFTSTVQVVVDWYGPIDLLKMDEMAIAQGCVGSNHNAENSAESELMGYQITTQPELVAKASPLTYISADDPPFFIEHGLTDCIVSHSQSQLLFDQLKPAIGSEKVKIKFLEDTAHGGGLFNELTTVTEAIDFLDLYLK